ncbi:MAG: PilZ domain-containing protein [Candidatus Omnitrophota bacterium]
MAPMETRGQKREPVNFLAEYAIDEATEKTIKLNVPAKDASGKAVFQKAGLLDISVQGCGLDSLYLIPPGVILDINIESAPFAAEAGKDRKEPMRVTGSVRSCSMKSQGHYRLGIQFTKISNEDKDLLSAFITNKERRSSPRWDLSK